MDKPNLVHDDEKCVDCELPGQRRTRRGNTQFAPHFVRAGGGFEGRDLRNPQRFTFGPFPCGAKNPKAVRAWEIGTHKPLEVGPTAPIGEVARLMAKSKIHHVVVSALELDDGAVLSKRGALLHRESAQHGVLLENHRDLCREIGRNALTLQILRLAV